MGESLEGRKRKRFLDDGERVLTLEIESEMGVLFINPSLL